MPSILSCHRLISSSPTPVASLQTPPPATLPLTKDPAFKKDRATFFTTKISASDIPIALNHIKSTFHLLETTLLADGRDWVLNTPSPSLSDIEAIWPLDWLVGLPGALPADQISAEIFPKVFAWIARFNKAISAARKANKSVQSGKVTGVEVDVAADGEDGDAAVVDV